MSLHRCPGQSPRSWKASDVTEFACPSCGKPVEFWKDEPMRACPGCGCDVRNPKMSLGCAEWCKFADKCMGVEFNKGGDKQES